MTFERLGNFRRRLNVLERKDLELELDSKSIFFRWKSIVLLSFESVPPSYPKYGFQLCADEGASKWKSNDLHTNLAWK